MSGVPPGGPATTPGAEARRGRPGCTESKRQPRTGYAEPHGAVYESADGYPALRMERLVHALPVELRAALMVTLAGPDSPTRRVARRVAQTKVPDGLASSAAAAELLRAIADCCEDSVSKDWRADIVFLRLVGA